MPILIYLPEGADPERFEFDFDDFTMPEAAAIEDALDLSWDSIKALYWRSRRKVAAELLVALMRRTEPGLTAEQLNLKVGQIDFDLTPAEQRQFTKNILAKSEISAEQRAALEKALEELPAEPESEDSGKA